MINIINWFKKNNSPNTNNSNTNNSNINYSSNKLNTIELKNDKELVQQKKQPTQLTQLEYKQTNRKSNLIGILLYIDKNDTNTDKAINSILKQTNSNWVLFLIYDYKIDNFEALANPESLEFFKKLKIDN